jgi:mono/diheme cytochrome c family protein
MVGRLVAANIPQIAKDYTDAELYRTIRHGVKKDGHPSFVMPTKAFYHIKEEAILDIIAYVRSLEPIDNDPPLPDMKLGIMVRTMLTFKQFEIESTIIDHQERRTFANHEDTPIAFGNYLTKVTCSHCHGDKLEGGGFMNTPGLNLTSLYSRAQFHYFLKTGEGATRKEVGNMTNLVKECFKYFHEDELEAIYSFLETLKNVEEEKISMD